MAFINVLAGVLLMQLHTSFAEVTTTELTETGQSFTNLDNINVTTILKLDSKENETVSTEETSNEQGQRQKRGYNFNGYPPFPPVYPNYLPRFDPSTSEDQLAQIHKRLSDIAAIVRQPTLPPVPPATRYPLFVPFVYIPPVSCGCTTPQKRPRPQPMPPIQNKPPPSTQPIPVENKNITVPEGGTPTRFSGGLEDERIWGIMENQPVSTDNQDFSRPLSFDPLPPIRGTTNRPPPLENASVVGDVTSQDSDDFSRPISFDPIPPVKGIKKVPPPVEHGSVQADSNSDSFGKPIPTTAPFINSEVHYLPIPDTPTTCDAAILTCCHQATISYNCFASQGCPDPTIYKNPCDTNVITKVIERFQQFYVQKNG